MVVLVRARNPLNIGAAARAMSNFGAHRLRLVNPYAEGFREARSAVGASDLLQGAENARRLRKRLLTVPWSWALLPCAIVPCNIRCAYLTRFPADLIRQQLATERVALLFGSEKFGLTNKDFSHCHWLLNIPTKEKNISMNLGQAVSVCLYELARNALAPRAPLEFEPATAGATEHITEGLLEALRISGYVKPGD